MTQKQQTPIDPNRILNINVGVLGHVDSGKTSLVKTLSTLLSTASLDKSAQSRQRGITLDLGFSAFLLPKLPPSFEKVYGDDYDMLQVTLVDCPGHASLIRTIIGGAQIIDMVLLVIDATKGIQTQTAECIVIAEMTAPNLIVALNKIDLFEPEERNECIEKVQKRIEAVLKQTRFKNAKMVPISAAVGGEKVAAVNNNNQNNNKNNNNNKIIGEGTSNNTLPTDNIQGLLDIITTEIVPPNDRKLVLLQKQKNKFHFSVDHCFPIKGQGTVVTGTCLSGFCEINDMIEFPHLGLERKVKSMQMFRRTVKQIKQGDRAGICLANLDPNLMERGVASSPGAVKLIDAAIAVVKKVRYFKGKCLSGGKFHVSVGHSTVMATVSFWGAKELQQKLASLKNDEETTNKEQDDDVELGSSSLGGSADIAGLPHIEFDFNDDFIQQDEMVESLSDIDDDPTSISSETNNNHSDSSQSSPPLQWAMLNFQTPVYCPLNSLIIGSRLDADVQANHCRLAFSGRLVQKCKPNQVDMARVKIYNQKERVGTVCRLSAEAYKRSNSSDNKIIRYDIYGQDLFKKETNMSQFIGLKLITKDGEIGVIQSSFGSSGKFKVHFPAGTCAREGDKLFLKFKRYLNDKDKKMHQGDELALPKEVSYEKIQTSATKAPHNNKNKKNRNNNKKTNNDANNNNTSASNTSNSNGKPEAIQHSNNTSSSSAVAVAHGEIVSLKSSDILENGNHGVAIVSGFFTPDVNVREKIGWKVVILDHDQEGVITGSFGKAGKCKVSFSPNGVTENSVGKKVALFPPTSI